MVKGRSGSFRGRNRPIFGRGLGALGWTASRRLSDEAPGTIAPVTAAAIDTNVYSAFMRGSPGAVGALRETGELYVPLIVLGELLAGFAAGARPAKNRDELARFMASPRVSVLEPDETTAHYYADIFVALRARGTPIPTNDLWIAALARQHRVSLLTHDRHFGAVPGLTVRFPATE
jgi:tRNA(fMet)-specific endonuclease VapC